MADFNAQPLERLINNFQKLPGVGRKGATRMAYQVLSMDKAEAEEFALSVYRKFVLRSPDVRTRNITNEQLRLFGYHTEEK